MILGLEMALAAGATHVHAYMDSQLVARQVEGIYRTKNPELAKLNQRVLELKSRFVSVSFGHVIRAENFQADKVVNDTIDDFLKQSRGL